VFACGLIVLIMLIFMVIQGKTAKNKEAVSTKILLNHIQMLALLSAVSANWSEVLSHLLSLSLEFMLTNWKHSHSSHCCTSVELHLSSVMELLLLIVPLM
jgi:hypothetical protein